jgi:hypothetical protein
MIVIVKSKTNLFLLSTVLLFCMIGNYSCSKYEGCVGNKDTVHHKMFLKSNLWDNFVQKKQYSFVIKNGNTIVDNITVKTSGEKLSSQTVYKGTSGPPDCPTTNNYKFYYKIYDYSIGDSNIINIVNNGQIEYDGYKYNNNIEINFLNSVFKFNINDLLSIYVPNYSDSILFDSKWIYNVYKLNSLDAKATLFLNYEIGFIKYEKDSVSWNNN